MFVRVAIAIPSPKTFTYAVPEMFVPAVAVGKRVLVPFGKRRVTGFVLEVQTETVCDQTVKEILDLPDPEPLFDPEDLVFYEWISRYYLHPLGKVLGETLPGGIAVQSDRWLCLGGSAGKADPHLSAAQKEILEVVARFPEGIPLSRLRRTLGKNDVYGDLRFLEAAGLIVTEERLNRPAVRTKKEKWVGLTAEIPPGIRLTARQSALIGILREHGEMQIGNLYACIKTTAVALRRLEKKGLLHLYEKEASRGPGPTPMIGKNENGITLNKAQTAVLDEIRKCLASSRFSPCLLHGVTGSGKTEVYLRAIAEVLRGSGGAIYLVPEIALTAQLLSRIANRFPEREIAVLHSGISQSARYDQWKRIRRGEVRVVVGARSALFAPVRKIGRAHV